MIQRDFLHVLRLTGEGWPGKGADKLLCGQEKEDAFHQWKTQTRQPKKVPRTYWKVFIKDTISICATLAKNINTLPSIIKRQCQGIRKRTYGPMLVWSQGTFVPRGVCALLPSTGQERYESFREGWGKRRHSEKLSRCGVSVGDQTLKFCEAQAWNIGVSVSRIKVMGLGEDLAQTWCYHHHSCSPDLCQQKRILEYSTREIL